MLFKDTTTRGHRPLHRSPCRRRSRSCAWWATQTSSARCRAALSRSCAKARSGTATCRARRSASSPARTRDRCSLFAVAPSWRRRTDAAARMLEAPSATWSSSAPRTSGRRRCVRRPLSSPWRSRGPYFWRRSRDSRKRGGSWRTMPSKPSAKTRASRIRTLESSGPCRNALPSVSATSSTSTRDRGYTKPTTRSGRGWRRSPRRSLSKERRSWWTKTGWKWRFCKPGRPSTSRPCWASRAGRRCQD
mmetsp:Transcript_66279/g.156014  ORF Transcript_66279/g.156014 Transcript_66279/m.156014 type:complete len:247 (+) Transcript_66279:585-1325(+)